MTREQVYRAIAAGHRDPLDISAAARLPLMTTRTEIEALREAGRVTLTPNGGYEVCDEPGGSDSDSAAASAGGG